MSGNATAVPSSPSSSSPAQVSVPLQRNSIRPSQNINFVSKNGSNEKTILLIHGAAASGSDWGLVNPHLSSYHLLIPSLFTETSLRLVRQTRCSGRPDRPTSSDKRPWISAYASHLAQLVKDHAKDGRAHIVGLSFGGCLAVEFATSYPDLCLSLFVSGLPAVRSPVPSLMRPAGTAVMWAMHVFTKAVGAKNLGKFLDGEVDADDGGWDGKGGGATMEMNGILSETFVYTSQSDHCPYIRQSNNRVDVDWPADWKFRIRLVAATRRSKWTPAADSPQLAIEVAGLIMKQTQYIHKSGQEEPVKEIDCRVYEAARMFHPWSRQLPELFARCILTTVEGTDFPADGLQEIWAYKRDTIPVK